MKNKYTLHFLSQDYR